MQKVFIFLILISFVLSPGYILASPGPVDQYGGHKCWQSCEFWDITPGVYHYHDIPQSPNYVLGYSLRIESEPTFYFPSVDSLNATSVPNIITDGTLIENNALDVSYCGNSKVFASGKYLDDQVRIRPVCQNSESFIINNLKIVESDIFKSLPEKNNEDYEIRKAYHTEKNFDGKLVYTDMPSIDDLIGLLIQGETDMQMYYVNRYDSPLTLRAVTVETAQRLFGENYEAKRVYFDDSIVYSYKIGKPLN